MDVDEHDYGKFENKGSSDSDYDDVEEDDDEEEVEHEELFAVNNDSNGTAQLSGLVQGRHVVTPGEMITDDTMWMRGHGTYSVAEKRSANNTRIDVTYSSVAGTISRVNKLLSVIPLRGRYVPEVGNHVVGRIIDVGVRSWHVDIGANQAAVLMLGSVNLPGGVQRRKSESDELQMRAFLKEGDLLNAEVQAIYSDGAASLHTRSLNYGKLRNGYFVRVPSSLVVRSKTHTVELPDGVDLVLGVNGHIWLRKHSPDTLASATGGAFASSFSRISEEAGWEIYTDRNDYITPRLRDTIARYANAIKALEYCEVGISETRIVAAYEASKMFESPGAMVESAVKRQIARLALKSQAAGGPSS
ncbi:uncharacterized protein V1518DRAFT_371427 [Limtongia smithiae]|uniref:uncharacterized protein n=1 Tax=Limtongia smithiae TaxID=1125753 RepID=UPI0034CD393F